MKSATQAFESVRTTAETAKSDAPKKAGDLAPGDYVRQGDIYLHKLACLPNSAIPDPSARAQLAPGESQGSRHCIGDMSKVQLFRLPNPNPLQGPVIDVKESVAIEHPEHAHITLEPGVYICTFQRLHADEVRRQMD